MKMSEEEEAHRFRTVLLSLIDIADGIRLSVEKECDISSAAVRLRLALEEVTYDLDRYSRRNPKL